MHTQSDIELIQGLRTGNHDCFAVFFDRYSSLAKAIALRIVRSGVEAEDVVQEAFMQVWRQADRFDETRGNAAAWVTMIARTRALDRLRRVASRHEDAQEESPDGAIEAPPIVEGLVVRTALHDLPEEQRVPLEMAYWQGFSQSEIAEHLGEPLGTVKTRMRAGLQRLREALD